MYEIDFKLLSFLLNKFQKILSASAIQGSGLYTKSRVFLETKMKTFFSLDFCFEVCLKILCPHAILARHCTAGNRSVEM